MCRSNQKVCEWVKRKGGDFRVLQFLLVGLSTCLCCTNGSHVIYLQASHLFLCWIQIMWVNLCFSFDLQLASMELDFEVALKVRVKDIGCSYLKLWNPKNSSLCVYFAGLLLAVVKENQGNSECMSSNKNCMWMHVYGHDFIGVVWVYVSNEDVTTKNSFFFFHRQT
jgi:hypothetical protein